MRILFLAVLLLCGCGGPNYDEALSTYKTELDLLNGLERARAAELAPLLVEVQQIANDRVEAKEKLAQHPTNSALQKAVDSALASFDKRDAMIKDKAIAVNARYADSIAAQQARVKKSLAVKEEAEKHR